MQNIDTIVTVLHTSDLLFCNSNDYFFFCGDDIQYIIYDEELKMGRLKLFD